MSAQFFSSLADNALLVAAIELLNTSKAPVWHVAALPSMFALFYVLLAPFVGAFADALPKGKVMFISNAIKVVGCLMMMFGTHPLLSYAIVGLGAAAYSPAKYGILTELLPNSQLVKANGWIEGLTILSVILGIVLGGQLVGRQLSALLLGMDLPLIDTGIDTAAGKRHRRDHVALPDRGALQPVHPAHRGAAAAGGASARWRWCATSRNATCGCGPTSWARSRWPRPRCSGASAATCASSSFPGPRRRWATASRRLRRWARWWRWARRWAPSPRRCACAWTRPPAPFRWASPWACSSPG